MVYEREAEQFMFKLRGCPTTMHTMECPCHTLLSHLSKKSDGNHVIIPHGAQFDHLFPTITQPHGYTKPLINASTGEPYPMLPVRDFSLEDHLFPGCPGDSFVFKEDELDILCKKGFLVPTYRKEPHMSSSSKEGTHKSSSDKEEAWRSGSKASKTSTGDMDSTSSKPSSHWDKQSPHTKNHRDSPHAKDHRDLLQTKDH